MICPYSRDECCEEIMLNLIYLTKCIIDLTVYPSKHGQKFGNPTVCLIKAVKQTSILQANTK